MADKNEAVKLDRKLTKKLKKLRNEPDESKALALLQRLCSGLDLINPDAAGIDIASGEHWVCLPESCCEDNVRCFGAYTVNLYEIRDWLHRHGVTSVAMESTGIYWVALYDLLEESGIEVYLVNARQLKSVCGRPKTDKLDCQWIQRLHTFGLLKRSFRPTPEIRSMRSLWRTRHALVHEVNRAIQRMQKALHEMNVLLPKVVSDITGLTGMTIMRAIAAGETDPEQLAGHRHPRVKKGVDEFVEALRGSYRPELVFLLKIALEHYDFVLKQETKIDEEIMSRMDCLKRKFKLDEKTKETNIKESVKYKRTYKHAPSFDVRSRVHEITGVDTCLIPGFGATTSLAILVEVGTDMTRWPDEKHFSSWLSLCPNPNISAGKDLGTHTKKSSNAAAYEFRMAAQALQRSHCHLGSFYRRMTARHGPAYAITATAHKLAVIFYLMLSRGEEYKEIDRDEYKQIIEEQKIINMQKRALKEGFELVPITPAAQIKYDNLKGKEKKTA